MNHEHHIVAFWRASLNFFTCEQLGMFAKLTLNAYRITLKILLKYFGWIFVVWFGLIHWPAFMDKVNLFFSRIPSELADLLSYIPMNLFFIPFIFFIVCAARSSITRKHWYYFLSKTARFYIPFIFGVGLYYRPLDRLVGLANFPVWFDMLFLWHIGLFSVICCLFYIDTRSFFKSLYNAFLMIIYIYPVFLTMILVSTVVFFLCFLLVGIMGVFFSGPMLHWISALIFWLFGSTMLVVMMSNIYIKHVYEYNKIYCPVP